MTQQSSTARVTERSRPRFDIVVPAFNEETQIATCLDHIDAQRFPSELVTVWVVDAGSTDGTAAIVAGRERADRTLLSPGRRLNAAEAVNVGVRAGHAPLVARVDAHTRLHPDYLRRAADAFGTASEDVACVGGQPEQVGETRFGRAVALARRSQFGVGHSVYSDSRTRAFVETVQAGVYRRDALEAVGGFTETMLVGEDEELNWRLLRAGHRILLDTDLRFSYTTRSSWRGAYRQYRNYGRSRARVLAAHPGFVRPRHLAPTILVCGMACLGIAGAGSRRARRMLVAGIGGYAAAAGAAALHATRDEDRALAPSVAGAFAALHVGYGVGLLAGGGELLLAALRRTEPSRSVAQR
jgi:cellulose synthase/poly-beta-1,6-N-acetylglucosamine synthase-like glycosyltransferase